MILHVDFRARDSSISIGCVLFQGEDVKARVAPCFICRATVGVLCVGIFPLSVLLIKKDARGFYKMVWGSLGNSVLSLIDSARAQASVFVRQYEYRSTSYS